MEGCEKTFRFVDAEFDIFCIRVAHAEDCLAVDSKLFGLMT